MRWNKTLAVGSALVLSTACGGVDDQEAVESLPDFAGTSLEINTAALAQDGAALVAQDLMQVEASLDGQGAAMLEGARLEVKALNDTLRQALVPIADLAKQSADAQPHDVLVYGPKDRANATFKLSIHKGRGRRYEWKLEARPLNSAEDVAYMLIAAGALNREGEAHRGRGTLAISLDNLKEVAPSYRGRGKLMMSFAHFGQGTKSLAYRLESFTPNRDTHEAVTGAFVGHKLQATGVTRVRVLAPYNLPNTATPEKEWVLSSVRHIPGTGGRADVRAWGGDITANAYYVGASCWDAQEKELYRVLLDCADSGCIEVPGSRVGSSQDCPAVELRGDLMIPEGKGNDLTPEPGNPGAPDTVPDFVTAEF
ncbi:hypothetical protein COCOR_06533 [Corallococcus coralloides DSM 2259]|uniref:Lipoprotein n=1 Tax=Corallococcus coralloides (strain ATCC 25202 / DSM 2259 / NBRC 100086 / M2) TaxID=1144275 RepID=H8MUK8_CORCM|nr:hypothetical protein [Corallococcus coralloides]AFE06983.1 hypothetical protein COCOR_06533 [Corallococcus coralloides DSM 2259]